MPPTTDPLAGVRAKIKRAVEHIADFDYIYARLVAEHGDMIRIDEYPDVGERVYSLLWDNPDATIFSLWAGDIVHNLRTALDHLAYVLCAAGPGGPASIADEAILRKIAFPVSKGDSKKYEAHPARGVIRTYAKAGVEKVLDAVEPYKGGKGECLTYIQSLDNTDKHRLLVTVALDNARFNEAAYLERFMRESGLIPETMGPIVVIGDTHPTYHRERLPGRELKAGRELRRESMNDKPKQKNEFVADITLDEPDTVKPQSLRPLLIRCAEYVNSLPDAFQAFV